MDGTDQESWTKRAFRALDTENRGHIYCEELLTLLRTEGVYTHQNLAHLIQALEARDAKEAIQFHEFEDLTHGLIFLKRVLEYGLVIPQYETFHKNFLNAYQEIKEDPKSEFQWGEIATYIPPLAKADPNWFATSFCSAEGQFSEFGDVDGYFSIQSVSKVVAYSYLHDIIGETVHKWVGEEPSGVAFNAPVFDRQGRPHNPMVNAGAIMVSSLLVHNGKTIEDLQKFYIRATNAKSADIDIQLYKDEAMTGHTNHALKSLMLANNAFPEKDTIEETKSIADNGLEFYFQQCSMLVNVQGLARFGAMLSNNGINPSTGERILKPQTVQSTVTLMQTCGMYNGAGKFTKDLGVPAKSGVSGGLMTVIPGIGAFATWSPKLNEEGNTVKGIAMIQKLSAIYSNFNLFHKDQNKRDLQRKPFQTLIQSVIAACSCAATGDLEGITRLYNLGISLDQGDYDKRTPLHLASAAGHFELVKFLINVKVDLNCHDRWGATPLNDAKSDQIRDLLLSHGAQKGAEQAPYLELPQANVNDDQYRLFYAGFTGQVRLMKSLHIQNWRVNSYDYDGRTALGIAASEGHLDAVKYLIVHGADPLHKDARGNDALADAVREGRTETIEFLKSVVQQASK